MGFFSWITSDTHRSIANQWSCRETFPVYLLQPHGLPTLREDNYDGYGVFGGRDVYALMAGWHGYRLSGQDTQEERCKGIDLDNPNRQDDQRPRYPIKLVEDPTLRYEDVEESKSCPDQGFFYDDEVEDGDPYEDEVFDGDIEDDEIFDEDE